MAALALLASGLGCQQTLAQAPPLSLLATQSLSFGAFVAGSGGTITVSPNGGRTKLGGVVLVGQGASAAAAQFTVSGPPGTTYAITLPADGVVQLSGDAGSMAVNAFISEPGGSATLPANGTQVLRVGARLTVGNLQPPGQYQGSLSVTVNYP